MRDVKITKEGFPPRCWLRIGSNWVEGHLAFVDKDEIPYISMAEHAYLMWELRQKLRGPINEEAAEKP